MHIFIPRRALPVLLVAVLVLPGCADLSGVGPKQGIGTLGGAAAGGLAGAQVGKGKGQLAMTALGALVGAFAGSSVGSSLDRADELHADRALQRAGAVRTGQRITWKNTDTGNSGYLVPTTAPRQTSAGVCREYQQTITVGGRTQQGVGTACQQTDGSWRIVS